MSTLANTDRRRDSSGLWVAFLVLAVLIVAVWGAWRLGVMAGQGVAWRHGLPELPPALRKTPTQPPQIPTQRRPAVEPVLRG